MDMTALFEQTLLDFDAREAEIKEWLAVPHPELAPHARRAVERGYRRELRDMAVRRPYLEMWQHQQRKAERYRVNE